ncbi:MAG: hypothetical protein K0Q57_105 [Gammaproteobacteria bacterium]|jgi:hypothetical protein|nr:hypothetical protein [Gammaproteobacteria bacterium]
MSNQAIDWALKQNVKGSRKAVLFALANRANSNGICWPGLSTLAQEAGYSRSTVIESTKALEKLGLINKAFTYDTFGKRSGIKYKLNVGLSPETLSSDSLPSKTERLSPVSPSTRSDNQTQTLIKEPSVKPKYIKLPLPEDFGLSQELLDWGKENGYSQNTLQQHLNYFVNIALAKNYKYADWNAAFKFAVIKNWAEVANNGKGEVSMPRRWVHEQDRPQVEPLSAQMRQKLRDILPHYLRKEEG